MRKKLTLSVAVVLCAVTSFLSKATNPNYLPNSQSQQIDQSLSNKLLAQLENLTLHFSNDNAEKKKRKTLQLFDTFIANSNFYIAGTYDQNSFWRCYELIATNDQPILYLKIFLERLLPSANENEKNEIISIIQGILPLCRLNNNQWGESTPKVIDLYSWISDRFSIPLTSLLNIKDYKDVPFSRILPGTGDISIFKNATSLNKVIPKEVLEPQIIRALYNIVFSSQFYIDTIFDKDGFLTDLPLVLWRDEGIWAVKSFFDSMWPSLGEDNRAFLLRIMKGLLPLCGDDLNKINKVLDFYDWFCWRFHVPLPDVCDSYTNMGSEVNKSDCPSNDFRTGKIKLHDLHNTLISLMNSAIREFKCKNCTGYWNIFAMMTQNDRKDYLKCIMHTIYQGGSGTCLVFQQRLRFLRSARELLSHDEFIKLMFWNFHDTEPDYVLPYVPDFIEQTVDALRWGYEHVPLITLFVNLLILPEDDILLSANGVFKGLKKLTPSGNIAYVKYEYEDEYKYEDKDVIKLLIWDETVENYVNVADHSAYKWGSNLPANLDFEGDYLFVRDQVYQIVNGRIYLVEGNLDRRENMSGYDVYKHFTQVLCKPDERAWREGIAITQGNLEQINNKFGDGSPGGEPVWSFFNKENLGEYYEQLMSFLSLSPPSCIDACLEELYRKIDNYCLSVQEIVKWGKGPIKLKLEKEDGQRSDPKKVEEG